MVGIARTIKSSKNLISAWKLKNVYEKFDGILKKIRKENESKGGPWCTCPPLAEFFK